MRSDSSPESPTPDSSWTVSSMSRFRAAIRDSIAWRSASRRSRKWPRSCGVSAAIQSYCTDLTVPRPESRVPQNMIFADAYFNAGYYVGAGIFLVIVGLVYWFVGRWGWLGVIIRIIAAILFLYKLFQVLFSHP